MKKMNLRDMYPFFKTDVWVDVDEEVAREMRRFDLEESAYRLRTYRHRPIIRLIATTGLSSMFYFFRFHRRSITSASFHGSNSMKLCVNCL